MTTLNSPPKVGVLITNLGTPEAPTARAVKKYLAEFLWDPYVVEISRPIWWLILYGIILRTRPKKSARLYQKIWTPAGSPLLVYSAELVRKLQTVFAADDNRFYFALGMRYGQPSIKQALLDLRQQQVSKIIVLPLYPQFSRTTTSSTLSEIERQLRRLEWQPETSFIHHYAEEESYISALSDSIQQHWEKHDRGQKLVFSFHGIPKKYILRGDPYYQQCLTTAKEVALQLNLKHEEWEVVFQSRFGREEWLQPYCNEVLQDLPQRGYKHIDVICPGFAVDCLETLEEMAISNKAVFHQAGGVTYRYIPALNDSDFHIKSLLAILIKHSQNSNNY